MAEANASLRDISPYPHYQPNDLKLMIMSDMLYTMRRGDGSELDLKVDSAYKKLFGVSMLDNVKLPAKFLHGTAGHGKTQSTVSAFKEVCQMIGLNPVINPDDSYQPSQKDGVMVVSNLSGVISSLEFKGMPITKQYLGADGASQQFMTTVPQRNYVIAKDVGFYALFFDDVSNASENVQNAVMDVVETKRTQSMDFGQNAYMILSGNYGSDDGSYTVPPSLPKLSRMEHIHFEDDKPSFIKRVQSEFAGDAIGDAGVLDYLAMGDAIFAEEPSDRGSNAETYACPRTWSKLINAMREMNNLYLGGVIRPSINMIENRATGLVGNRAGPQIGSFLYDVITNVQPIAKQFIENGKLETEMQKSFDEKYSSSGQDQKNQQFGFKMCASLARNAASAVINNGPDNRAANLKVYENFCRALTQVHSSAYPFAFTWLASRLANGVKEYQDGSNGIGLKIGIKEDIVRVATSVFEASRIVSGKDDQILSNITSSLSEFKAFNKGFRPPSAPTKANR